MPLFHTVPLIYVKIKKRLVLFFSMVYNGVMAQEIATVTTKRTTVVAAIAMVIGGKAKQ